MEFFGERSFINFHKILQGRLIPFRGRPIFLRGKTHILWNSSGVKVILLIFRGRKKTEVLKTGKALQILHAIA